MGMSRERRMVVGDGHLQAPDHSSEHQQHCGSEKQGRRGHSHALVGFQRTIGGRNLVAHREIKRRVRSASGLAERAPARP